MIADEWEIARSELDELALRSHRLAHQATVEGRFERELVHIDLIEINVFQDPAGYVCW